VQGRDRGERAHEADSSGRTIRDDGAEAEAGERQRRRGYPACTYVPGASQSGR